ncbi:hypothetical protein [Ferrimonas balearica]|uniref:hypothetical protein n=1 Tax=Ferrimonas balearica TaxID=44012 RepID=UPI001C99ACA1|nr:hypothetical protein [Ferrimonas balearica]MBY5991811.1 hypothetical protein [Ferrimonas balearica]
MSPDLFWLSCLAMGAGIGADVALASATTASLPRRARLWWLSGVTATHTLFPMVGYLLTAWSVRSAPDLMPLVGLVAAGLLFHFYLGELFGDGDAPSCHPGQLSLTLLLAISYDALWSGPAKSAQVVDWPLWWVWASFAVVGVVVLGFALVGMALGRWLMARLPLSASLRYLQLVILGYFGALALCRYCLSLELHSATLLTASALVTAALQLRGRPQALQPRRQL